jgi:hypothetical protein
VARLNLRAIGAASTSSVTPGATAAGSSDGSINILSKILPVPSTLRIP